ncbi:MAG: DNA topoisomerase [Clostridiales bacterium]|nr:DNA topoisomerase [Clostridiales bacterium]
MGKSLYIAEKPSVAQEFAKALHINGKRQDGYLESNDSIVTWCVGHLVTMSYPEVYDPALKKWSMETIPFLPAEWKYEVIPSVKKQYNIVKSLLHRSDVDVIYVCTDSGREGEYIYRLVEQMAGVEGKKRLRVWIDSQTEEEIQRGIAQAKDLSEYDNLSASAYLRAKEDYLMGINFSRALTLKFGTTISNITKDKWIVLSIGRVMTCVLGMVVRREREIRTFVKTPFYRVIAQVSIGDHCFDAEWRAVNGSHYFGTPALYKENGFKKKETAQQLIQLLEKNPPCSLTVIKKEKKKEKKYAPLLFNLAELQNECSRRFKISPDTTLKITQELYEKKLVTYPRTDARVLSSAVAKQISRNIAGLRNFAQVQKYAVEILEKETYKTIAKSRYVNDKQITDHYAIVPTGQGFGALKSLSPTALGVYERIVRRFLSIFYPPAVYEKYSIELEREKEHFFASFRQLESEGYLAVANETFPAKRQEKTSELTNAKDDSMDQGEKELKNDPQMIILLNKLKKGDVLLANKFEIKEGETSPPKRYNSGSMILAMENAGQLIEDEELRAQIKGSGIGTSATRAEILKKLVNIRYLALNGKTQMITPTLLGELVFDVVDASMRQMLNPELTASWEKGLSYVAEGSITPEEYMNKLETFVTNRINHVKQITNPWAIRQRFEQVIPYYRQENQKTDKKK